MPDLSIILLGGGLPTSHQHGYPVYVLPQPDSVWPWHISSAPPMLEKAQRKRYLYNYCFIHSYILLIILLLGMVCDDFQGGGNIFFRQLQNTQGDVCIFIL